MATDPVLTDDRIALICRNLRPTHYTMIDFARAIERAILRSSEVQQMRKDAEQLDWQPIETAPTDGSHILAWVTIPVFDEDTQRTEDMSNITIAYWFLGDWMAYPAAPSYVQGRRVTHWMPLPAPPSMPA